MQHTLPSLYATLPTTTPPTHIIPDSTFNIASPTIPRRYNCISHHPKQKMARFSDLPPELVLNILRHVDPRNLVPACILSKAIFLLAASILKEHSRLTEEFSASFIDICTATAMHDFLAKVLAKPQNADYVRDLTVGADRRIEQEMNDPSLVRPRKKPRCNLNNMHVIRTAIENTKHICTDEVDVWLQAVQYNTEDTLYALLIVHLPNLERLKLAHLRRYASRMTQKIRDAPTSKYLCHLKKLTIDFSGTTWGQSEYLKFFAAFLSLPSLACCRVESLDIDDDERDTQRYIRPHESAVLELQFLQCRFGPETLFEILEGTKCLSSITYYSTLNCLARGSNPLEWYWLAVGLWRYARHSLEKVVVNPFGCTHVDKLCDFREFTLLREIEAETTLLFSGNTYKAQSFPWMLPASLHILHLHFSFKDYAQRFNFVERNLELVHIILKVKQALLPHLTEIQLCFDGSLPESALGRNAFLGLQEACNLQGISLSLRKWSWWEDFWS